MLVSTHRWRRGDWDRPPRETADGPHTLVLAFAGSSFWDRPEPLDDVRTAFPESVVMGCSTAGEIAGSTIDDNTVTVAVTRFDHTTIAGASAPLSDIGESYAAGASIARQLQRPDLVAVFVLSTGLQVNGSDLVRGMNDNLGPDVVVTGGLAADGAQFTRTWVMDHEGPRTGYVTAVGLFGDRIRVGHGSRGGWSIFGPERRVTRSEGSVLYELDGKPALALYKDYLGELAAGLPATGLRFPLALRESSQSSKQLVRTILAVDEETQAMMFAGDLPEGWMAQLMRANFDELVGGAEDAAQLAGQDGQGPCLAIAISCVGRRMVLGEGAEEEVEATLAHLPPGTTQVGFYSNGELSPYTTGPCDLHNQTMTLTTLREADTNG